MIADEVESAVDQLAIDSVVSSKWPNDDHYKTLDYPRLKSLHIPAINTLNQRVQYLKSKVNGTSNKQQSNICRCEGRDINVSRLFKFCAECL